MALLSDTQIKAVRAKWMRNHPKNEPAPLNKADLLAVFVAIDKFLSDNAGAINNALPTAAKNNMTTAQKARLLKLVIEARYGASV